MMEKFDLRDRTLNFLEENLVTPFVPFPVELNSNERIKEFIIGNKASLSELLATTSDPRSDQLPLHSLGILSK